MDFVTSFPLQHFCWFYITWCFRVLFRERAPSLCYRALELISLKKLFTVWVTQPQGKITFAKLNTFKKFTWLASGAHLLSSLAANYKNFILVLISLKKNPKTKEKPSTKYLETQEPLILVRTGYEKLITWAGNKLCKLAQRDRDFPCMGDSGCRVKKWCLLPIPSVFH